VVIGDQPGVSGSPLSALCSLLSALCSLLSALCSRLCGAVRNWQSGEAQTFVILWVRLPPVLLKVESEESRVKSQQDNRLSRLLALDSQLWALSHSRPSGATGRHAALRTPCPSGLGVRLSPWSLRGGKQKAESQASLSGFLLWAFRCLMQAGQVPGSLPYGEEPGSLPGPATG
jgi:hypothetical protein